MLYFTSFNLIYLASIFLRKLTYKSAPAYLFVLTFICFVPLTTYRNGFDWPVYEAWFTKIAEINYSYPLVTQFANYNYIDWGFAQLMYFLSLLSNEFVIFQVGVGSITIFFYHRITKKFGLNFFLFMAVLYCTMWLRLETSTLRQALVVPLFWLTLYYAYNRFFLRSLLVFALALTFHKSIIVLVFALPLLFIPVKKSVHTFIVILGIVIQASYVFLIPLYTQAIDTVVTFTTNEFVAYKLNGYLGEYNQPFTIQKLLVIISLIYFHAFKLKHVYYGIFMKLLLGQFIINFYFPFVPNVVILRFEYFFTISWVALLSVQIDQKMKNLVPGNFIFACIVLVLLNLKLLLFFKDTSSRLVYMPYNSVFHYVFGLSVRDHSDVQAAIKIHESKYSE
jgi:hypothetical protein